MKPVIPYFFPAFTLALLLVACDSSSTNEEGEGGGAFDDKCALACKPEKACSEQDPSECEQACVTAVEDLRTACAQCIVEHTGWSGDVCTCEDFEGEQLCSYEPFAPSGTILGPGDDCTPGMAGTGTCDGFTIGKASSSQCEDVCGL